MCSNVRPQYEMIVHDIDVQRPSYMFNGRGHYFVPMFIMYSARMVSIDPGIEVEIMDYMDNDHGRSEQRGALVRKRRQEVSFPLVFILSSHDQVVPTCVLSDSDKYYVQERDCYSETTI